jgi:hypothetical protein
MLDRVGNAPMAADTVHVGDSETKAKIFISYSRKDMAFADRLDAALKARGFAPLIDREEIYAFEDWWKRIETLIGRADTVVFVISPDAVASNVALKEVEHAASLNKRFAPIVCARVEDSATPQALRRLNFIFFDDPTHFDVNADQLAEVLQTDIGWIRQHTEFGEAARRWSAAGRRDGLLLHSPVLEEAERWIASRPQNAPAPTEETRAFITESRRGTTRRRNILIGSFAAGLSGLLWALFRIPAALFSLTISPNTAIVSAIFFGVAVGILWGGFTAGTILCGWNLFKGQRSRQVGIRFIVTLMFGILGGILGGVEVSAGVFYVFDAVALYKMYWIPSLNENSFGDCVATGYCLFYPALGIPYGVAVALGLAAMGRSSRWERIVAPHIADGQIMEWRTKTKRTAMLGAVYSIAALPLFFLCGLIFVWLKDFPLYPAIGETVAVYFASVGTVIGIVLGELKS